MARQPHSETYTYTVLLDPDPERGGFTVTVPAIPEVVTEGDDEAHALAMAQEAISLYLRYARDKGLALPVERAAPRLASVVIDGMGGPTASRGPATADSLAGS